MDPGRRAHLGGFYDGPRNRGAAGPAALVHGNCQAEALRVLLVPALPDLDVVRVPPVHEQSASYLPHLDRLLRRAVLPVSPSDRDLPLRTALRASRTQAALVVVPTVRITVLHPFQSIVRDPADPSLPPPLVACHDLRTLAAAGHPYRPVDPQALVDVGRVGLAELARRERR